MQANNFSKMSLCVGACLEYGPTVTRCLEPLLPRVTRAAYPAWGALAQALTLSDWSKKTSIQKLDCLGSVVMGALATGLCLVGSPVGVPLALSVELVANLKSVYAAFAQNKLAWAAKHLLDVCKNCLQLMMASSLGGQLCMAAVHLLGIAASLCAAALYGKDGDSLKALLMTILAGVQLYSAYPHLLHLWRDLTCRPVSGVEFDRIIRAAQRQQVAQHREGFIEVDDWLQQEGFGRTVVGWQAAEGQGGHPAHQLKFTNLIFENCNFRDAEFLSCHFSRTQFVDCVHDGSRWDTCDFYRTVWQSPAMKGAVFYNSTLDQCSWLHGDLSETTFDQCRIWETEWQGTNLQNTHWQESTAVRCLWQDTNLTQSEWWQSNLFHCHWEKANVQDALWEGCQVRDSLWDRCSLDSALFDGGGWTRSACFDCTLNNTKLSNLTCDQVLWQRCSGNECIVVNSLWKGCGLNYCRMSQLSLLASEMHDVHIHHCGLEGAAVFGVTGTDNVIARSILVDSYVDLQPDSSAPPVWRLAECQEGRSGRGIVGVVWNRGPGFFADRLIKSLQDRNLVVLRIPSAGLVGETRREVLCEEVATYIEQQSGKKIVGGAALVQAARGPVVSDLRRTAQKVMQVVDGLVLPGGADIEPEWYGKTTSVQSAKGSWDSDLPLSMKPNLERSITEFALIQATIERSDRVALGVCRGAQIWAVAHPEGALDQHVRKGKGMLEYLQWDPEASQHLGAWGITPDSRFPGYFHHHQGIAHPGKGNVVLARSSASGAPAVIVGAQGRFLGLQLHPEFETMRDDAHQVLCEQGIDPGAVEELAALDPPTTDKNILQWLCTFQAMQEGTKYLNEFARRVQEVADIRLHRLEPEAIGA